VFCAAAIVGAKINERMRALRISSPVWDNPETNVEELAAQWHYLIPFKILTVSGNNAPKLTAVLDTETTENTENAGQIETDLPSVFCVLCGLCV